MAFSNETAVGSGQANQSDARQLQFFVMGLFFIFGGITSLNDVIIPKLKELFTLSYTQAMLVQFCFFTAYAVIGIPGARLVKKIGYMRGAVVGLLTMMVGCLLFIPASQTATYALFLLALFVLASGVVIVQVVSNPLISVLGKPETVHSRLTFAQAFNSLGTTVFPYFGSILNRAPCANSSTKGKSLNGISNRSSAQDASSSVGCSGIVGIISFTGSSSRRNPASYPGLDNTVPSRLHCFVGSALIKWIHAFGQFRLQSCCFCSRLHWLKRAERAESHFPSFAIELESKDPALRPTWLHAKVQAVAVSMHSRQGIFNLESC